MSLELTAIPLVDHHCHTLLDDTQATNMERFIRATSEAPISYPLTDLKETVTYEAVKRIVRHATGDSVDDEADFARVFGNLDYRTYCRRLFQQSGYERLFIDTGYTPEPAMGLDVLAEATGTYVHRVLRLERLAQDLRKPGRTFDDWLQALLDVVSNARKDGYIGAKSIIAYRSGLGVHPVSREDAKAAFDRWSRQESARLNDADLLSFILWKTAPRLIEQGLPLQFHTGYGDPDEDLAKGNPLLLRDFIEDFCLKGLSITLLHTYPYHREAGYLASVYPGVYFDVSLIIPLGTTSSRRVMAESLELTPMSRFLFASDAHTRPEMFALSADLFRDALQAYFLDASVSRFVDSTKIERWCRMILNGNARALYLAE